MNWIERLMGRRVFHGDHTGGLDIVGGGNMGTVTINGRTYTGNDIQLRGNKILVDGRDVTADSGVDLRQVLEVVLTGDVHSVQSDKSISVKGNVGGDVKAGGSVNCGRVGRDAKAGGSVNCDDVQGDVDAGGSVSCDKVGGNVRASGSVSRS